MKYPLTRLITLMQYVVLEAVLDISYLSTEINCSSIRSTKCNEWKAKHKNVGWLGHSRSLTNDNVVEGIRPFAFHWKYASILYWCICRLTVFFSKVSDFPTQYEPIRISVRSFGTKKLKSPGSVWHCLRYLTSSCFDTTSTAGQKDRWTNTRPQHNYTCSYRNVVR